MIGENVMENKVLYESKGCQNARIIVLIICDIIIIIVAIFWFWLSGAKRTIRGGYMFSEEGRTKLHILGWVCLVLSVFGFDTIVGMMRCWIKIYQDHIEAQVMTLGIKKNVVHLFYNQINFVQIEGYSVNVIVEGKKIKLICKDTKYVFELINQKLLH